MEALALYRRQLDFLLSKTIPHRYPRWAAFGAFLFIYCLKTMILFPSHPIISYGLAIYFLGQAIGVITPKFDPALDQLTQEESSGLPELLDSSGGLPGGGADADEKRPFIPKVGEFAAWKSCVYATAVALFATFFSFTDVPVLVPVLVVYFCVLVYLTMRKQLAHMRKYGYDPFDFLKKPKFGAS